MHCTIVHNPASRRGKRVARRIERYLAGQATPPTVRWITRPDRSVAPDGDRVIVAGGDGTVNIAARWMWERDARLPLAIVPGGTGNNLARGLGLPEDGHEAVHLALTGTRLREVDAMLVEAEGRDGRHRGLFLQSAALGFPADASRRFDELRRRPWFKPVAKVLGDPAYALVALAGLPRLRRRERRGHAGIPVVLDLPDETIEESIFAMFLGNEPTVGGGFVPTPAARVDDGRLDLCWVRGAPPDPYLRIFRGLRSGRHVELKSSVGYRQTGGPVTLRLGEPTTLMADGELPLRETTRLQVAVLPGRFPVVVPDAGP